MTDKQRIQATIDQLSMEIPRRLPPDLRQVFLTSYPDGKYGQLIEANYLRIWDAFAARMETGGFFEMIRHAAVRPLPDNARPPRTGAASFLEEIEHKRQRQQEARRERVKHALENHPLARLRSAAVKIIEACDQIAVEGRVH